MNYFKTLLIAGLVASLSLAAPLPAADLTGLAGAGAVAVKESGRIDLVNLKDRYLIVDDTRYALAPEVQVQSSSGANVQLGELRRGMRIAFALQAGRATGTRTITKVVIRSDK